MHELSIALSILDLAADEARRQGGGRVVAIRLRLGALAGVVPAALRSAYEMAREIADMPAADLIIDETPIVVYCATCAAAKTLASCADFCCSSCQAPTSQVVSGREMEVVALEIES